MLCVQFPIQNQYETEPDKEKRKKITVVYQPEKFEKYSSIF